MLRLLDDGGLRPEAAALVVLGLNHEQQHQELILTDIKHAFWMNPLRPAYAPSTSNGAGAAAAAAVTAPLGWRERSGGTVEIGAPSPGASGEPFAFDNEGPRHAVLLTPHALASRLVTCGEYREFIADGGYRRPELWLSDGWDAVQAGGWSAPLYWEEHAGQWWSLTFAGMQPVRSAEPISHVSYYEADAYARWAQARLPTEAEWEAAAASRRGAPPNAIYWRRGSCGRCRPGSARRATVSRSSSVMSGSGRRARTRPIPAFAPPPAPSVNTTASSCATRSCCAGAPV